LGSHTDTGRKRETDGVVIREKRRKSGQHDAEAFQALQRDLALRLHHLKAEAREVSASYLANVDSDVSTLLDFLNGSSEVRRSDDVKAQTLEAWLKTLDHMRVKPGKGRAKDLRRIDRAIRTMMETAFE